MKNKKTGRWATLGALTLALCGALYLNWSFAQNAPGTVTVQQGADADAPATEVSASADAGQQDAVPVFDPLESETQAQQTATGDTEGNADKNYGEAQLVSVNPGTGNDFFEAARLSRSKNRDEVLDTINESLKKAGLTQEEKDALTEQLSIQVTNMTLESEAEVLIKAKGFADCVVMVNGNKATVTVMTENDALTAEEVTRIRDVVTAKFENVSAQDITVVEVK